MLDRNEAVVKQQEIQRLLMHNNFELGYQALFLDSKGRQPCYHILATGYMPIKACLVLVSGTIYGDGTKPVYTTQIFVHAESLTWLQDLVLALAIASGNGPKRIWEFKRHLVPSIATVENDIQDIVKRIGTNIADTFGSQPYLDYAENSDALVALDYGARRRWFEEKILSSIPSAILK